MDTSNTDNHLEELENNPHARWMPGGEPSPKPEQTPEEPPKYPEEPAQYKEEIAPSQPHHAPEVKPGLVTVVAQSLSAIFSPLLVPTYACAIALWITPWAFLPERARLMVSLLVFLLTGAIPMACIIFMIRIGKVSDAAISDPKQRTIPYLVSLCSYIAATLFLWSRHAPQWLYLFYAGAAVAVIIAMVITRWWKISAHATCMGGLCAMVFFIAINGMGIVFMLPWMVGALLLTGAVGSARLYLLKHTAPQVYAGFLLGLVVEYFFMWI